MTPPYRIGTLRFLLAILSFFRYNGTDYKKQRS